MTTPRVDKLYIANDVRTMVKAYKKASELTTLGHGVARALVAQLTGGEGPLCCPTRAAISKRSESSDRVIWEYPIERLNISCTHVLRG
jgi:hypothetical protein